MIHQDTPNALLVCDGKGVIATVSLPEGQAEILAFTGIALRDIAMAPNGELWGSDGAHLLRINQISGRSLKIIPPATPSSPAPPSAPLSIQNLSFDPDGVLHALDTQAHWLRLSARGEVLPPAPPFWPHYRIKGTALSHSGERQTPLSHPFAALACPRDGRMLYGVTGTEIHRIDPDTGESALLGDVARLGMQSLCGATATLESALTTQRPVFCGAFYLRRNPDVAAAGIDPRQHYDRHGWYEGRPPSPKFTGFDPVYYYHRHADLFPPGADLWQHFCEQGWQQGANPSADFDVPHYLSACPDVAASGMNPLIHYLCHGIDEGRPVGFREWVS